MTDMPEGQSPWERDDWMPEARRAVPFPSRDTSGVAASASGDVDHGVVSREREVRDARDADAAAPVSRVGRSTVVGVVVTVAIVAAIALLLTQRDTGSSARTAVESGTGVTAPSSSEVGGRASSTSSPATVPTTPPDATVRPTPDGGAEVIAARPDGSLPDLAPVETGQVPPWVEWSVAVPSGLDSMAQPTEVVVFSTGMLHRIEFPSGRVRSVALAEWRDPSAQMAVAGDSFAVTVFSEVILLGDAIPAISTDLGQGVDMLRARPAQGDFLVTGRRTRPEGPDQLWLLAADGTLADLAGSNLNVPAWEQGLLPDGSIVVNRPGGAYSVGLDGTARRLDDGSVVALGANHRAVTRCDAELQCAQFMVDSRTEASSPVDLGPLSSLSSSFSILDPSMSISPDGRFVVFTDWQRPQPMLRLIDVSTGEATDLGGAWGEYNPLYSWAADSSGVFTTKGDTLLFNGVDGELAGISGLGPIHAIAAQPLTSAE